MFLHRHSKTGNVAADGAIAPPLDRDDNGRSAPAYERGETMKPNIGITDKDCDGVVKALTALLADEYVLYTKTRNYHWNVVGPHFSDLHKFFESQYEELDDIVDEVAERARAVGGHAIGTLEEFARHARVKEHPAHYPASPEMIVDLLGDHETIIRQLRKDVQMTAEKYHDVGTSDFLTGILEQHEKMGWMLRANLDGQSI
jgi:starvation-inducible DNA-binding protein